MKLQTKAKTAASVVASVGLVLALSPASAFGVTSADVQAEINSVSAQLNALNDELSIAVDDYNMANRDYEAAMAAAADCQQKIETAQAKITSLQSHIETRATSMYRSGSMSYLDVLMGSASFDDFATVWDTLNTLNADDAELVASSKEAKAELDAAKVELDQKEAEAAEQLALASSYRDQIESMTAQYESIYNSLSAEYQQILAQEEAARAQAAAAASAAYFPSVSADEGVYYSDDGDSGAGYYTSGGAYLGGSDAVSRAQAALGIPYVYGASSSSAFDCSGLVSYALTGEYGHAYVSQDFWGMSEVSDPQPGDVVACSSGHCGLYIGDGQMIEAPHTGASVKVSAVRGKIVRP